jgi:biopolymer transport protein ExbD
VNPHRLPSGLTAVSSATAQHLVLEIDQAGTLFLSKDSGVNWEQVSRQWTGRAVEVRAKTGLRDNAAPATGF